MTKADLKTLDLPDAPGVYFFLDSKKKILYIGKATSLKNRVRSYFATDIKEKRSELIENMVTEAATVEVTKTESVLDIWNGPVMKAMRESFSFRAGGSTPNILSRTPRTTQANVGSETASAA